MTKELYYIGGNYEKITENGVTQELYYIGDKVIYVKQAGQPDKMYYVIKDHLGSVVRIVNSSGTAVFAAEYDVWGRQTVTTSTFAFHRGFTGHEHLPEFGLINMNGRMYDPVLGRFLSPDPFVQMADFSQSYNRYSYCLNNPLLYVDPSGEFFWIFPYISLDKGGVSFGISAGIGFGPNFGISGSLGYSTGDKSFTATAGLSFGPANAYVGYNSNAGFIAGAGIGFGNIYNGNFISMSSNMMNIGLNYSAKGGLSGNYMGTSISQQGVSFNPSITAGVPISFYTDKYEGPAKLVKMKDSPFKSEQEMLDDLKTKGFTPGKHKINEFLYRDLDGKNTAGKTRAGYVGKKLTYLSITMYPHETTDMFYESFNHELIHAYDHVKYGTAASYSYTETKAYRWTDRFATKSTMPSEYTVYKGPMDLFDIPDY